MDLNNVTLTGRLGSDLELKYTKTGTAVTGTKFIAKEIPELSDRDEARFWRKVDKTSSEKGCWIWVGGKRNGYGNFKIKGKEFLAHRITFFLAGGTFDNGPLVLHGPCNNRACCNPLHLSSGTYKQNMDDKNRDGTMPRGDRSGPRLYPERMPRGDRHFSRTNPEKLARGEACSLAKLTADSVLEIRSRSAAGELNIDLAKSFGVSKSLISVIVRREVWKHI